MKAMVVYDSVFGNTEEVAQAMGRALGAPENAEARRVSEVKAEELMGLEGVKVAAFDTRIEVEEVDSAILTFMVRLFGYAAKPIASRLEKKAGDLVLPPEGFIVEGTEGPLGEGELERAADWARQVVSTV